MSEWQTSQDMERETLLHAFHLKYQQAVYRREEQKKIRTWSLIGAAYSGFVSLVSEYVDGGFGTEQEILGGASVAALAVAGVAEVRRRREDAKAFSAERHIIQLEAEEE